MHRAPGLALTLLLVVACGESASPGGNGGSGGGGAGPRETWVASRVTLPLTEEQARTIGFDLDGDGKVNNALGRVLVATQQAAGSGVDIQGDVDAAVQSGGLVQLVETHTGASDSVSFRSGSPLLPACTNPADPTTCGQHLTGTAAFDAGAAGTALTGHGTTDDIEAGPGSTELQLAFFGGKVIELPLLQARVSFHRSGETLVGQVGGAVPQAEVQGTLLGSLLGWIATTVDRDCPGGSCMEGSTGATLLQLFDTDHDGAVTLAEVQANPFIAALLTPDVDTDQDGTKDAISVGLGYELVGAVF